MLNVNYKWGIYQIINIKTNQVICYYLIDIYLYITTNIDCV